MHVSVAIPRGGTVSIKVGDILELARGRTSCPSRPAVGACQCGLSGVCADRHRPTDPSSLGARRSASDRPNPSSLGSRLGKPGLPSARMSIPTPSTTSARSCQRGFVFLRLPSWAGRIRSSVARPQSEESPPPRLQWSSPAGGGRFRYWPIPSLAARASRDRPHPPSAPPWVGGRPTRPTDGGGRGGAHTPRTAPGYMQTPLFIWGGVGDGHYYGYGLVETRVGSRSLSSARLRSAVTRRGCVARVPGSSNYDGWHCRGSATGPAQA